jgi:hypothetical protein
MLPEPALQPGETPDAPGIKLQEIPARPEFHGVRRPPEPIGLNADFAEMRWCCIFWNMNFLRSHWYDLAGVVAPLLSIFLALRHPTLSVYEQLMWCNLIALLLHQFEEYRLAATFPGMVNAVLYRSTQPERFPLNPQTALVINVGIGWTVYLLAAFFAERAVWLGMGAILVSAGNVVAHVFVFNMRGRSIFNAGMITALLYFLPVVACFFRIVHQNHLAHSSDYVIGIALGILLNVVGILKMIDWMADPHTAYAFSPRQLLPADRKRAVEEGINAK